MSLYSTFINVLSFVNKTKMIITLFQEDNIFGLNASLTYGPQLQNIIGN